MNTVIGQEEQHPAGPDGVVEGRARDRAGGSGKDVLHENRAGHRAIALPQLLSLASVGEKEQRVVDRDELAWTGARRTGSDVLHENRAASRAFAAPQLGPAVSRECLEVEEASELDEPGGRRPRRARWQGVDVLHQPRRTRLRSHGDATQEQRQTNRHEPSCLSAAHRRPLLPKRPSLEGRALIAVFAWRPNVSREWELKGRAAYSCARVLWSGSLSSPLP